MKKLLFTFSLTLLGLTGNAQLVINGDLNYDGELNITDIVKIVDIVLGNSPMSYLTCPDDHHPHLIDLGLSSGTKWACCNVGATAPEDYGGYYAWGETEEKAVYDRSTYEYYQNDSYLDIGNDIAGTQYDVAHVKWGDFWVMPSLDQIKELEDECQTQWTTKNGISGWLFTGKNGSTIFLPAAGGYWGEVLRGSRGNGYYWSSIQKITDWTSDTVCACCIFFNSYQLSWYGSERSGGQSVRPVSSK